MIVYLTTNKVNGKKYIGSTNKTYEQAIKANYLGSQKELKADIENLGADKFNFEVIEQCNDLNHCLGAEWSGYGKTIHPISPLKLGSY